MRGALRSVPLVLALSLLLLPVAAGAFTVSVPADSAVTIGSPSRLLFTVTNTDATESLSRLVLQFPSGYQVTGGSPPAGWTVEQSLAAGGESAQIVFRTTDEAICTNAIASGSLLVFGVEVIAPRSGSVAPDSLRSAQAEQSCRGVILDPPATLPSWNRLGIEAVLAAGPPVLGVGGTVTATMTVTNLSSIDLTDISPLLASTGTGSLTGVAGPTPGTLALASGASGAMSWAGRAVSAGTVSFSGQAVGKSVTSSPVRSDILFVVDLDVSLTVSPDQVLSGQAVQVEMTVTNRGAVRVVNVTPAALSLGGTATASAPGGPTPTSQPVLEPGESTTFTWAAAVSGQAGDTYAFSGWASAEGGAVVSANATSNLGVLAQQPVASDPGKTEGGGTFGGGEGASTGSTTTSTAGSGPSTTTTGATVPPAVPSATVQFVSANNDGTSIGGAEFSGNLVRALRIIVGWQNLTGSHSQRLELFTPDGSLYQQISAQFAGTPVETRLPVSGTWITQYSLFGAWRVDVFLDGGGMPITSGVFVLDP